MFPYSTGNKKAGRTVVMEQFFNQVNMSEHHASATVPLQLQLVQGITDSRKVHEEYAGNEEGSPFAHVPCE